MASFRCRSTTSAILNEPQIKYQRLEKLVLSLHHLEEAQALLSDLSEHGPHEASPAKRYRESRSNRTDIEMGIEVEALKYKPRTAIKGQVLVDFIADFAPRATEQCDLLGG